MKNKPTENLIGSRILEARTAEHITQVKLAEMISELRGIKLSRGAVSQWELKKDWATPAVENMSAIAISLNVSFEWIATGRGDRYVRPNEIKDSAAHYLTNDENAMLNIFRNLKTEQKKSLNVIMLSMTEQ